MAIPCAVLMCHAPIVLPQIGGARSEACSTTTAAMNSVAATVVAHEPDLLVVISPHAPRHQNAWGIMDHAQIHGDFAAFGSPDTRLALPGAPKGAACLTEAVSRAGLSVWRPPAHGLDHGALVPLHFLVEAGWAGPTLVVTPPVMSEAGQEAFGQAIARASATARWAIVASGDMSHRLQPGAPAGYHPRACEFDQRLSGLVEHGHLQAACTIDAGLRRLAAEDVIESLAVASAAVDYDAQGHQHVAYEGPFGVGYLEAILHDEETWTPTELLKIAREAVQATSQRQRYQVEGRSQPAAAFVTLRDHSGGLRGCIGSLDPVCDSLEEEVAWAAAAAASRDPRFAPVSPQETAELELEISILGPLERVASVDDLDPRRFGVVVTLGSKKGVLLPELEGITTPMQQLRGACDKGRIDPDEPLTIERFSARKLKESRGHHSALN